MKDWKGFAAWEINRHIERTGPVWQKDYRDRIVRNAKHFLNCARYIRTNPAAASLKSTEYLRYESNAIRALLDSEG